MTTGSGEGAISHGCRGSLVSSAGDGCAAVTTSQEAVFWSPAIIIVTCDPVDMDHRRADAHMIQLKVPLTMTGSGGLSRMQQASGYVRDAQNHRSTGQTRIFGRR